MANPRRDDGRPVAVRLKYSGTKSIRFSEQLAEPGVDRERTLATITDKVEAGERLSFDEGVFLDEQVDILTLGRLANIVRERKNGNFAFYNTNVHLNPTNVCVYRCTFCAFRADLKAAKAYEFTDDMVRDRVT